MKKITESVNRSLYEFHDLITSALRGERGQTVVEYAILLVLIAMVVVAAVTFIGGKACNMYSAVASSIHS